MHIHFVDVLFMIYSLFGSCFCANVVSQWTTKLFHFFSWNTYTNQSPTNYHTENLLPRNQTTSVDLEICHKTDLLIQIIFSPPLPLLNCPHSNLSYKPSTSPAFNYTTLSSLNLYIIPFFYSIGKRCIKTCHWTSVACVFPF